MHDGVSLSMSSVFVPGLPCGAETPICGVGATGLPVGQVPLGTDRMVDLRSD